jgi:hypothetical protein
MKIGHKFLGLFVHVQDGEARRFLENRDNSGVVVESCPPGCDLPALTGSGSPGPKWQLLIPRSTLIMISLSINKT